MTIQTHIPGFPRTGAERELKFVLERHWRGELDAGLPLHMKSVGAAPFKCTAAP